MSRASIGLADDRLATARNQKITNAAPGLEGQRSIRAKRNENGRQATFLQAPGAASPPASDAKRQEAAVSRHKKTAELIERAAEILAARDLHVVGTRRLRRGGGKELSG